MPAATRRTSTGTAASTPKDAGQPRPRSRGTVGAEIAALEATAPDESRRDEIEAILSGLPARREVMEAAEREDLVDLFDAFDPAVTDDKSAQMPELDIVIGSDLAHTPNGAYENDNSGAVTPFRHGGERFERISATAIGL